MKDRAVNDPSQFFTDFRQTCIDLFGEKASDALWDWLHDGMPKYRVAEKYGVTCGQLETWQTRLQKEYTCP